MSDSVEAIGGLVDAALVAAASQNSGTIDAAEAAHVHHRCANCDTPLSGHFCSNCGQKAHVHRSLLHVGEEFLHGITHFDGKAWRTLPMLVFRPGRLTRDYIMGKRARYIAPVPLFLLVVFTMFFAFSFIGGSPNNGKTSGLDKPMTRAEAVKALPGIVAELNEIDKQIADAKAKGETAGMAGLIGGRAAVVAARDRVQARANDEITNPIDLPGAIAAEIGEADANGKVDINIGVPALDEKVRKALKNPELFLYKIQNKAYKLSFLLVPLSLPWLWLLFAWKRDVRMYDHAVFALYSISFMSLLFIVGSIAVALGIEAGGFWFSLVVAAPVTHMFVQLKGAYALTNGSAAWRTAVLGLTAVFSLALYALLMIVIGALD